MEPENRMGFFDLKNGVTFKGTLPPGMTGVRGTVFNSDGKKVFSAESKDGIWKFPAKKPGFYHVKFAWIDKDVDVRIITCDPEKKRLVLSGREVARDRRREERRRRIDAMQVGTVLEGTVETIKPYGAFVDLGDGISGLVHVSQMSQKRVENPAEVVKEGEKVKVKITKVADGKISLSMKALEDAPVQEKEEAVDISLYTTKENATTNLGELLKGLKFD